MTPAYTLPEELTIFTVGEQHPRLLARLSEDTIDGLDGGVLALEAGPVADVDGAGIQLLLALSNSLQGHGRRLVLQNASERLATACRTLGAADLLDEPSGAGEAA